MIEKVVVGLVPELETGMQKLIVEINHATSAVQAATAAARKAGGQVRRGGKSKKPVLGQAVGLLGRFSTHLDSQPPGTVDRLLYFPEDGTAGGVGKGAARVLLALVRISDKLNEEDCPVRDRDTWKQEFGALSAAMTPVVGHADDAKTSRTEATPELTAARQSWMQVYVAAKCGVECVLRLTGKMHLMKVVFHDLAVPAGTKITKAPTPPTT
jgi:hypothetical protein